MVKHPYARSLRLLRSAPIVLVLIGVLGVPGPTLAAVFVPIPPVLPPFLPPFLRYYSWSVFRQNNAHTGYTSSPAPKTAALLWQFTTGGVIGSSPAVAGGVLYIGSFDNKTYALNASTGAKLWEFQAGGMVGSSPALANGRVFVGANDNKLYALNQSTGAKLWEFATGYLVAASPAVADSMVFIASLDGKVYALDETTGAKKWEFVTGNQVWSSPAVANGKVFVGSNDKKVYALAESTGAKLWEFLTGNVVGSSPAVSGGVVFIGSFDGKVYAFDEASGAKKWEYATANLIWSSPAVGYGKVFVGSYDKKVYALNQTTGGKIWEYTTGGYVFSSPAVADGMVFIGSGDRRLYALNESTGQRIWDYTAGDIVNTSPAVVDGKVYIGSSDKSVYAFGTHDIAVTSLAAPSTVALGDLVEVNATVLNTGDFTETFQVDATYDGNKIGTTQIVSGLTPDSTRALSFKWNTQGLSPGNYSVKVLAWPVSGETGTSDNEKGPIIVTLGKAASSITVSVPPTSVAVGSPVLIQGSISPARGGVVVTIQQRQQGGSWVILANATTGATGTYEYTWLPTSVGTYEVKAVWPGDASTLPDESDAVSLTVGKAVSAVSVSVSAATVQIGGNMTIRGSISPAREGISMMVEYRLQGATWSILTTGMTNATGAFTYTWSPDGLGTYEVRVSWAGDASTEPGESSVETVTVAKAGSSLTLAPSTTTAVVGETLTISGSITPIRAGATVTIEHRLTGQAWTALTTVTLDPAGGYTYLWTPSSAGTYELRAVWTGDALTSAGESQPITVTLTKATSTLTITLSATSIDQGTKVDVQGSLAPARPTAVTIQARPTGGSWTTIATVTATAAGAYSYTWTPGAQGTYELKATWTGDAAAEAGESAVVTLQVRPPPPLIPLELLVALVATVAVALIVVMFLRRRPKAPAKPKPSMLRMSAQPAEILADGKSSSTLIIELLDAEGKPLATEVERQVFLSATEGRAPSAVTIAKGQVSARAMLTSSTTVGTVSVSASSSDLRGARVELVFREKRRYCMHCGQRMTLEARVCSACGNAPPSGVDTKACRNCGSVIPIVAKFCAECGAGQPT